MVKSGEILEKKMERTRENRKRYDTESKCTSHHCRIQNRNWGIMSVSPSRMKGSISAKEINGQV